MGFLRSVGRFLKGLFARRRPATGVEPSSDVELETELRRGMRGD